MLDIVETLTTQFDHQIIPKDVVALLNNLVAKGLIKQELLLQKLRSNAPYLVFSTIIVGLGEEAKLRATL
ncbi:22351_t:CDS:2 [Gigaspora rosea]|nr:22351_t:CDS:2 [Gigaspora rosea]